MPVLSSAGHAFISIAILISAHLVFNRNAYRFAKELGEILQLIYARGC